MSKPRASLGVVIWRDVWAEAARASANKRAAAAVVIGRWVVFKMSPSPLWVSIIMYEGAGRASKLARASGANSYRIPRARPDWYTPRRDLFMPNRRSFLQSVSAAPLLGAAALTSADAKPA